MRIDDVWSGREEPGHVLALAEQLKLIHDSRIRALWLGGIEFLGWDVAQYARANLYDLIAALAKGLGGKSMTDADRYPRPTVKAAQETTMTIADFNIQNFMNQLAGGK